MGCCLSVTDKLALSDLMLLCFHLAQYISTLTDPVMSWSVAKMIGPFTLHLHLNVWLLSFQSSQMYFDMFIAPYQMQSLLYFTPFTFSYWPQCCVYLFFLRNHPCGRFTAERGGQRSMMKRRTQPSITKSWSVQYLTTYSKTVYKPIETSTYYCVLDTRKHRYIAFPTRTVGPSACIIPFGLVG